MTKYILTLSLLILSLSLNAQMVMDSLSDETEMDSDVSSLISERIEKVSPNKKIFIISNENQSFNQGDFISLLIKNKLVTRALVAKVKDNIAGIKILKIYNTNLWKNLKPNREIQIIRGDDSYYQKMERRKKGKMEDGEKEIDLYDQTVISEDLLEEDTKDTVINSNNMISLIIGWFEGLDSMGESQRYSQINFQYMYQAWKNLFIELDFGTNVVKDFPSGGLDTRYYNIVPRVKYTFEVFWGLVIQPYLGYQFLIADSPGAGQDPDGNTSTSQLQYEVDLVNNSEKSTFAVGLTLIQPIVPGWNVKADLGTDIFSIGVGLEI